MDKYGVAGPECYETANNGIQYNYVGLTNIAGMAKVTLMPSSKILLGLINYDSIGVSLVTSVLSKITKKPQWVII